MLNTSKIYRYSKNLSNYINIYFFRLRGLIAYLSGHFTAYCLRSNGRWELHDDSPGNKITIVNAALKIVPHAAIFVRC